MANINLLPTDLKLGSTTLKAIALANRIAIGLAIVLLMIVAGGVLINFLVGRQIRETNNNSTQLRTNIQKLEGVEQKLFLIKDRAQKGALIYEEKDVSEKIEKINTLLTSLPEDVALSSMNFDAGAANFSIISKSSSSMALFINKVIDSKAFTKVTLKSFNFNQNQGNTIANDTQ